MITEEELLEREDLTQEETEWLMDRFDVSKMDMAEEVLDVSFATFNTYWFKNLSESHHEKIIHFFLRKFANEDMKENGIERSEEPDTPGSEEEDSTERNNDVQEHTGEDKEEQGNDLETNGSIHLNHLVPDSIIFKPRDGVGDALEEAAEIAEDNRAKVLVRVDKKLISVRVEES